MNQAKDARADSKSGVLFVPASSFLAAENPDRRTLANAAKNSYLCRRIDFLVEKNDVASLRERIRLYDRAYKFSKMAYLLVDKSSCLFNLRRLDPSIPFRDVFLPLLHPDLRGNIDIVSHRDRFKLLYVYVMTVLESDPLLISSASKILKDLAQFPSSNDIRALKKHPGYAQQLSHEDKDLLDQIERDWDSKITAARAYLERAVAAQSRPARDEG